MSTLLVVLALGAVFVRAWRAAPQTADLRLSLGGERPGVVEASVGVFPADESRPEALCGGTFRFAHGAPATIPYRAELGPGAYLVRVQLRHADGAQEALEASMTAPVEGTLLLRLRPSRPAPATATSGPR